MVGVFESYYIAQSNSKFEGIILQIILGTKVACYSKRSRYILDNAKVVRVDAANIKESVEKSLERLNTDYIDLLQIQWCYERWKLCSFLVIGLYGTNGGTSKPHESN